VVRRNAAAGGQHRALCVVGVPVGMWMRHQEDHDVCIRQGQAFKELSRADHRDAEEAARMAVAVSRQGQQAAAAAQAARLAAEALQAEVLARHERGAFV